MGKKLSFFVAIAVLVSTGVMGVASYRLMETRLAENLHQDTLDTAALLSSRIRTELRTVADKSRILAAAALEEFKIPDDQIKFLEDHLAADDQLIAMSLHRRSGASQGKWVPVFRLTRPENDRAFMTEKDFHELDLKYPIDTAAVENGDIDVATGTIKDGIPVLRMALPFARKKGAGYTQFLQIELHQERMVAAFAEATAHFSYLLDKNGRVLIQTDPTHFTSGEDLSQLPIYAKARATSAQNGALDYHELPGGMLQYGSFHKVGYAGLTVVSQASRMTVLHALRNYTRQALLISLACTLVFMAFALWATWSVVGSRLKRMAGAFRRISEGKFNVNFPERQSTDEIGDFAQALQEACGRLMERDKVHGTFAKLKGRKVKAQVEDGKINLKGERLKAIVMQCHLRGIEAAIASAHPEDLIQVLNGFSQAVCKAVESSHGIVDHLHGGSVVAYWGIPSSDKADADHALSTCLQIRKIFQSMKESLKKENFPEISLSIGMHYGPVVAGQVGTADRLEYTAFGEAVEVAARLQSFTEQFHTDILVSGPMLTQAPPWFSTEKIAAADDSNPDLYELTGKAKQTGKPAQNATEDTSEQASGESSEDSTEATAA